MKYGRKIKFENTEYYSYLRYVRNRINIVKPGGANLETVKFQLNFDPGKTL